MKRRVHPDMLAVLRRAMELKPSRRFENAAQMLAAYLRASPRRFEQAAPPHQIPKSKSTTKRDWKSIRQQQFLKQFGKQLQAKYHCHRCHGPVAESMFDCPWCGTRRKIFRDETGLPGPLPALPPRHEARLALLPLVLRPRLRAAQRSAGTPTAATRPAAATASARARI